ncbi:MAG: hypothetical protein D3916_09150, partial [Candidatus Electrothrix sp. MAN1_4]|nr:hypothetical protein [Candidatus Electrothrix sp. MAN1_4]
SKNKLENYIIIGSSCVNPAAEQVMRSLYKNNEKNIRILSKTIRKYKSRSQFSIHIQIVDNNKTCPEHKRCNCKGCKNEQDSCKGKGEKCKKRRSCLLIHQKINKDTGIFIDDERYGTRELREHSDKLKKETALLILCSRYYIDKKQRIDKEQFGEIIILSGFGKYGTFELSRVLSRINIDNSDKEKNKESESNTDNSDKKEEPYKELTICLKDGKEEKSNIEKFFAVINSIRREKKPNPYCIEAVFEFDFKDENSNGEKEPSPESIEHSSLKLDKTYLKWFCLFDPDKQKTEEDLLKRLEEGTEQPSESAGSSQNE